VCVCVCVCVLSPPCRHDTHTHDTAPYYPPPLTFTSAHGPHPGPPARPPARPSVRPPQSYGASFVKHRRLAQLVSDLAGGLLKRAVGYDEGLRQHMTSALFALLQANWTATGDLTILQVPACMNICRRACPSAGMSAAVIGVGVGVVLVLVWCGVGVYVCCVVAFLFCVLCECAPVCLCLCLCLFPCRFHSAPPCRCPRPPPPPFAVVGVWCRVVLCAVSCHVLS